MDGILSVRDSPALTIKDLNVCSYNNNSIINPEYEHIVRLAG